MDIVESDYMKMKYPDRQENEPQEYSQCYSCGEVLFVGDEAGEFMGSVCCDLKSCIVKMTGVRIVTLESGEE